MKKSSIFHTKLAKSTVEQFDLDFPEVKEWKDEFKRTLKKVREGKDVPSTTFKKTGTVWTEEPW